MGPAYDIILYAKVSICHHLNYYACYMHEISYRVGIGDTCNYFVGTSLKVQKLNGWQLYVATTDIKHASC